MEAKEIIKGGYNSGLSCTAGQNTDPEASDPAQIITHQHNELSYIDDDADDVPGIDKQITANLPSENNINQDCLHDKNSDNGEITGEFGENYREDYKLRPQSFLWPEPPFAVQEDDMDSVNESLKFERSDVEEDYIEGSSLTELDTSRDDIICHTNEYNDYLTETNGNHEINIGINPEVNLSIPQVVVTGSNSYLGDYEHNFQDFDQTDMIDTEKYIMNPTSAEMFFDDGSEEVDTEKYLVGEMDEEVLKNEEEKIQHDIRTSTILPPLCTAQLGEAVVNLQSRIEICAVDYQGKRCTTGGDPIVVGLKDEADVNVNTFVEDLCNGMYEITFTPQTTGRHKLSVSFFDRQISGSPFMIDVRGHNEPVLKITSASSASDTFKQPANVLVDKEGAIFVLDTGNCRICKFNAEGEYLTSFNGDGFERQGSTGFCFYPNNHLMTVNWRTKTITEREIQEGEVIRNIKCEELVLPTDVSVTSRGEIVVVDQGTGNVCVLDPDGFLKYRMKLKSNSEGMDFQRFVTVDQNDHIFVADLAIREYSRSGKYKGILAASEETDGNYTGITVDHFGNVLASKSYRGRGWLEIYNGDKQLINVIDSYFDRLRRPSGLAATSDHHVFVADLGNNCLKKYRYK